MGTVWFGTKEYMQWVEAPQVDIPAGKNGSALRADFLNGGTWTRRSKGGSKKYVFSWNMKRRDQLQPITDYADGMYGNGYVYYSNPFAMDRNVLPQYVAQPAVNAYDGPWLIDGERPLLQNNGTVVNGFPLESAVYTLSNTDPSMPEVYIPIPPTHVAHIGAHGYVESGSANVTVRAYTSATSGTDMNLTLLSRDTTLTNLTLAGSQYQGFSIRLTTPSSGVLRLDGLIAQVLKNGSVGPTGAFISGQGQSGMSFANSPVVSEYNAVLDRVGASVELVETEAWAWQ